jgi:hypothetical protein
MKRRDSEFIGFDLIGYEPDQLQTILAGLGAST